MSRDAGAFRRTTVVQGLTVLLLAACGGGGPTGTPGPTTGTLQVQLQGLSGGVAASLQVSGPAGYAQQLSAGTTLTSLAPGSYTIAASATSGGSYDFAPTPASQSVEVTAGATATATVSYQASTGAITLGISGLPGGIPADVTFTPPGGTPRHFTASGSAGHLAPGSYAVAVGATTQFGMGWVPTTTPATVTVTAGSTAAVSLAYDLAVAGRSTTDRPDDLSGPQVKLLYVVPSDGVDASLDLNRTLLHSVGSWQRWLAGQAQGRYLRLDTYQGAVDIAFVRLPRSGAVMASYGLFLRDSLEKDLGALGWTGAGGKLYAVYYDGVSTTACGTGPHPPLLPGIVTATYIHGTPPGAPGCDTNPFAVSATAAPGYIEFVMIHEIVHMLGGVSPGAPDYVGNGHVGNDPHDLMYAGAQAWNPTTLDVAGRNYFSLTGLAAGVWNLAASGYLAGP